MERGKFIVLYGINNLGKTTQAHRLVDVLNSMGIPTLYQKYAVYDLEPSGPIINDYFRGGNQYDLSPRELQLVQALNRTQYEPFIEHTLSKGRWVVAEDYAGSAMMWGMAAGIDRDFLIRTNNHLIQPNVALLFHGQRFTAGIEINHKHEQDPGLTNRAAAAADELSDLLGWKRIFANSSKELVAERVWDVVAPLIPKKYS